MDAPTSDLADLLARTALRDRAAFARLYRLTSAHLLGVAWRITLRREQAEEVLQDAFISIWQHAGSYQRHVAAPMTWLINIVRNRAIDGLRAGREEAARTHSMDDDALDIPGDPLAEPSQLLAASIARQGLERCMSTLSASQRQAVALAYYRGLAHGEIAETLAAPLGTVKAWVRRGLDRLKTCLGDDPSAEGAA
ncbi:sigma-70 family RNA polymerase sigma factor [Ideonella sp. DXS29W]|uniref:RNA polymerase sigma factor n=1 Tax=Ideonella lacteola TaxID=2984193 RepID=A0ABU9BQ12_9BURK